ncbi:N-acetyltransferase [Streptomyces sp. SID8014]|uniref:GNAT family N-acetyltransferase n=1 Tax=Streptomyces sp. SID8014 TaxID=2706097 RepID=UPI0013BD7DD3|nr:GNAT family N-acetyltransferase [Streptomyces sp. SID8014]NEC12594.1 N-acetyltransferase [Streptomyces sp. SID8014]
MSETPGERPVPELIDDRPAGMLRAVAGDEVIGHIQYLVLEAPEAALAPVHTIVDPGHEGQGVGSALAAEFYAMADREGVAVAPLCPYVARWAERHPDQAAPASEELLAAARAKVAEDPALW